LTGNVKRMGAGVADDSTGDKHVCPTPPSPPPPPLLSSDAECDDAGAFQRQPEASAALAPIVAQLRVLQVKSEEQAPGGLQKRRVDRGFGSMGPEATLAALSSELHSLQVKREEKAPGRLQKRRVGESTLAAMSIELRRLQVKAEAER
jgi:hypothetical protein